MEEPELIAGLKNAVDRGYSLELAVQSFINAGYNRQDIEDSARSLGYGGGIISHAPSQQPQPSQPSAQPQLRTPAPQYPPQPQVQKLPPQNQIPQISQIPQQPSQPQISQIITPQQVARQEIKKEVEYLNDIEGRKNWFVENWLIILLAFILVLLLTALGFSIFKKEWVLGLLKSMGFNF